MNSPERHPRSESVLKRLPPDRQAQIVEYANQPGVTLVQTAAWLRADGIVTNKDSLSRFLCWYVSLQNFKQSSSAVEGILETLKEQNPEWTEEQLTSAGNCLFSQLAIQRQDNLEWVRLQREKSRKDAITVAQSKLELELKKYQDAVAAAKKALTPAASGAVTKEALAEAAEALNLL